MRVLISWLGRMTRSVLVALCLLAGPVFAERNPYCTEPQEALIARMEQRILEAKSLWEVRGFLLDDAKLLLACFLEVRDAVLTREPE